MLQKINGIFCEFQSLIGIFFKNDSGETLGDGCCHVDN